MIYYGKQNVNDEDIQSVVEVLRSDFLTQGPMIERFERCVADYCGAKYAVAVTNATSALHIACLAAGLDRGDVLWTSPITFVASANCGRYCGADVDFVDIDIDTYNISVEKLEEKLKDAKQADKLPKVVVPVHMAGQSCDKTYMGIGKGVWFYRAGGCFSWCRGRLYGRQSWLMPILGYGCVQFPSSEDYYYRRGWDGSYEQQGTI
jgi:hypothetical protein